MNPQVYKESVIVKDIMLALKSYMKELTSKRSFIASLKTSDRKFLSSKHAATLKQSRRSVATQGYILSDGALLVEKNNKRLKGEIML